MRASTCVLLPVAALSVVIGVKTYDKDWHVIQGENGYPHLERLYPDKTQNSVSVNALPSIAADNYTAIRQQLALLATDGSWCKGKLTVLKSDVSAPVRLPDSAATTTTTAQESTVDVSVCPDPETMKVSSNRIVAFMTTHPKIEQREGAPSLFATYKTPTALPTCIEVKEAMRTEIVGDLQTLVGDAATRFVVELHVDSRNVSHPCDDPVYIPNNGGGQ